MNVIATSILDIRITEAKLFGDARSCKGALRGLHSRIQQRQGASFTSTSIGGL